MDVNRVRYFHVFVETGSLVKASEILHISQPALSKALKVLEREVGIQLLSPDGRGLKLTEAGKRFRNETRSLLNDWLQVAKRFRNDELLEPRRIASFEVFTTYFLGQLLMYTDLSSLEVQELSPGRMEEAVANGEADFGITYLPIPRAGIDFIEVTRIKMGVFGTKDRVSTNFMELPFVVPVSPNEGTPSKVVGLDGWPDHLIARNVRYRVTMMESALVLCRGGHAVAFLPEFIVGLHNAHLLADYRLEKLECSVPKEFYQQSVFLIRRTDADETKVERQIARSLRSLK